jgi:hypothetical protein
MIRHRDSRKYSARPKAVGLNGAASIALFRRPRESNPHFMRDLFLTADRRRGGHMFQCRPQKVRISIQFVTELKLNLPITLDYLATDL